MSNVRVTTKGVHQIRELTWGRGRTRYRRVRNSSGRSEEGSNSCLLALPFVRQLCSLNAPMFAIIELLSSLTELVAGIFVFDLRFDPSPYETEMCICDVIYLLAFFFRPPLTFKWATSMHIESVRQLGGGAVLCVRSVDGMASRVGVYYR